MQPVRQVLHHRELHGNAASHANFRLRGDMKTAPEKHLRDLVKAVEAFVVALDREMSMHEPTVERGKKVAALINQLELVKDLAKRFGLMGTSTRRRAGRTPKPATPPS
jgi:hypothetical protein